MKNFFTVLSLEKVKEVQDRFIKLQVKENDLLNICSNFSEMISASIFEYDFSTEK